MTLAIDWSTKWFKKVEAKECRSLIPAIHWILRHVNWIKLRMETYFFWQICAVVIAVKQRLQVLHLASKTKCPVQTEAATNYVHQGMFSSYYKLLRIYYRISTVSWSLHERGRKHPKPRQQSATVSASSTAALQALQASAGQATVESCHTVAPRHKAFGHFSHTLPSIDE